MGKLARSTCLLVLLCLSGCGLQLEGDDTGTRIINEILASRVESIIGRAFLWGVLGAAAGFFIGLVLFFVVRRLGGFRLDWRHARWLRLLVALGYIAASVTFFAAVGSFEGGLHGTRVTLTEGHMGKEVLPPVGQACATFIAAIDVALRGDPEDVIENGVDMAPVAAFEKGEVTLDVARFMKNLAKLEAETARRVTDESREHFFTKFPDLKDTLADTIMTFVIEVLAERTVKKVAGQEPIMHVFTSMGDAASRATTRGLLTYTELTDHVLEEALIPWTMTPIKSFVRGQQQMLLLTLLVLLLVPVIGFRTAHYFREKKRAAG